MGYILTAPDFALAENYIFAIPQKLNDRVLKANWPVMGELERIPKAGLTHVTDQYQGRDERFEKGLTVNLVDSTFPFNEADLARIEAFEKLAREKGFALDKTLLQGRRSVDIKFYENPERAGAVFGINMAPENFAQALIEADKNPAFKKALSNTPIGHIKSVPYKTLRYGMNRNIFNSMHERADTPPQ